MQRKKERGGGREGVAASRQHQMWDETTETVSWLSSPVKRGHCCAALERSRARVTAKQACSRAVLRAAGAENDPTSFLFPAEHVRASEQPPNMHDLFRSPSPGYRDSRSDTSVSGIRAVCPLARAAFSTHRSPLSDAGNTAVRHWALRVYSAQRGTPSSHAPLCILIPISAAGLRVLCSKARPECERRLCFEQMVSRCVPSAESLRVPSVLGSLCVSSRAYVGYLKLNTLWSPARELIGAPPPCGG